MNYLGATNIDYTSSYIIYVIMFAVVLFISGYFLWGMFKNEKELHRKKKSTDKKDAEEYAKIKKAHKQINTWFFIALALTIVFYCFIGVWGVAIAIIVRVLAEIITNLVIKD